MPPPGRGLGRVAFLARIEEVRAAIEAGWPLLTVYKTHAEALNIGYGQFTRYVASYLGETREKANPPRRRRRARSAPSVSSAKPEPSAPPAPSAKPAPPAPTEARVGQPRFRWNPNPNKDELI